MTFQPKHLILVILLSPLPVFFLFHFVYGGPQGHQQNQATSELQSPSALIPMEPVPLPTNDELALLMNEYALRVSYGLYGVENVSILNGYLDYGHFFAKVTFTPIAMESSGEFEASLKKGGRRHHLAHKAQVYLGRYGTYPFNKGHVFKRSRRNVSGQPPWRDIHLVYGINGWMYHPDDPHRRSAYKKPVVDF